MGNCGSAPKTNGDNLDAPAPEPAKEELVETNYEEAVKVQQQEKKLDDGNDEKQDAGAEKQADENKARSLGCLLDKTEEKKEANETEKTIQVSSETNEEGKPRAEEAKVEPDQKASTQEPPGNGAPAEEAQKGGDQNKAADP